MIDDLAGALNLLARLPTRVLHGPGTLTELGQTVAALGATRVLLVSDRGLLQAGHVDRATNILRHAGIAVSTFTDVVENPDSNVVDRALPVAIGGKIDFIVGLGGGSAMDCAKGINLLLTNGGAVQDYWGINKAKNPMLPSVLVPTTAGTGSEAQSFALIADPNTHRKMACGDKRPPDAGGLRPLAVILDPELTLTAPKSVTVAAGIDAIAHAVETAATTARSTESLEYSKTAWELLDRAFPQVIENPSNSSSRMEMMLGAHLAGAAIEQSMLGAAHACANPLTARFGFTHGVAVGLMLPHVVRFNCEGANPYSTLHPKAGDLIGRLEATLRATSLPTRISECGVSREWLGALAESAAVEWTAGFNPRPVGRNELFQLYEAAF